MQGTPQRRLTGGTRVRRDDGKGFVDQQPGGCFNRTGPVVGNTVANRCERKLCACNSKKDVLIIDSLPAPSPHAPCNTTP